MRKLLSTSEVARLLGVAPGSVINWVDQGELKAGRTPGGHRRVRPADLVEFLQQHKLPVPPELAAALPTILVVAYEPDEAEAMAEMLRSEFPDCPVVTAGDVFAAGELVASLSPRVVVLDLIMPGLDGLEVCRRMKARENMKAGVLIAVTDAGGQTVSERAQQAGAAVCLNKPVDRTTLLSWVRAGLGRGPNARPAGS